MCANVVGATGFVPIPTATSTTPATAAVLAVSFCGLTSGLAEAAFHLRAASLGGQSVALGTVSAVAAFQALGPVATVAAAWPILPRLGRARLACVGAFLTTRSAVGAPTAALTALASLTAFPGSALAPLTAVTTLTPLGTATTASAPAFLALPGVGGGCCGWCRGR